MSNENLLIEVELAVNLPIKKNKTKQPNNCYFKIINDKTTIKSKEVCISEDPNFNESIKLKNLNSKKDVILKIFNTNFIGQCNFKYKDYEKPLNKFHLFPISQKSENISSSFIAIKFTYNKDEIKINSKTLIQNPKNNDDKNIIIKKVVKNIIDCGIVNSKSSIRKETIMDKNNQERKINKKCCKSDSFLKYIEINKTGNEKNKLKNEKEGSNSSILFMERENVIDVKSSDMKGDNIDMKEETIHIKEENINNEEDNVNMEEETINMKPKEINMNKEDINIKEENINMKEETININEKIINMKEYNIDRNEENINMTEENINIKEKNINLNEENINMKEETININEKIINMKEYNIERNEENINMTEENINIKEKNINMNEENINNNEDNINMKQKDINMKKETNININEEYINIKEDNINNKQEETININEKNININEEYINTKQENININEPNINNSQNRK